MSDKYEEYISSGTRRMMEYLSSSGVGEGERVAVISAFSDALSVGICDSDSLDNYEKIFYDASLLYLDKEVSAALSKSNSSYEQYEAAIVNCRRIGEIIQLYDTRGWTFPRTDNQDIVRSEEVLRARQDSLSISGKVLEIDRKISELLPVAEKNLEVQLCDQLLNLLEELGNGLTFCKQKKTSLPPINNKDTKKIMKKVSILRDAAEQKAALHQKILDVDLQIYNLDSLAKKTPEQWQMILNLCDQQSAFMAECQKKQWLLPTLKYDSVDVIANRYQHYLNMDELDRNILTDRDNLVSRKQYRVFLANCEQQNDNIQACKKNDWAIPELKVENPAGLIKIVQDKKKKRENIEKIKRVLKWVAMGVALILILVVVITVKYREGKVKIPFDASYVVGIDVDDIYEELVNAGFVNISKRENDSGWFAAGEVIGVTIDNRDNYDKDQYKKPEVSVVIHYSSANRVYITDLLKGWRSANYQDMEKLLHEAGFTNIITESIDTSDSKMDRMMASLFLNGQDYTNEHCYLPKNAPIVISYYSLKIGIGNDNNEFIGHSYEDVVNSLEDSGFTNVQTEKNSNGWACGNSVVGVTVNNNDSYDGNQTFEPNVKIVVKYSSNDRIDATSIVEGWSTQKYNTLQTNLKNKGFTNITVKEKTTTAVSQNLLTASITINNGTFDAGDCYVQKTAPIVIEYYVLNITPGQGASSYSSNTAGKYTSVVQELKNMGFTNITVYRNNDLINGWITKEGSIEKISIDGNDSFSDSDSFRYDAPIVIVVNTFKGRGCDDITATEP